MRIKTQPSKDYHDSHLNHLPNRIALRTVKKGTCPAEVGVLALVSGKLATELPALTALAIDPNIDIICIQEHRYIHREDIKYHATSKGWTFVSSSA